jgi:hypothetical protein
MNMDIEEETRNQALSKGWSLLLYDMSFCAAEWPPLKQ